MVNNNTVWSYFNIITNRYRIMRYNIAIIVYTTIISNFNLSAIRSKSTIMSHYKFFTKFNHTIILDFYFIIYINIIIQVVMKISKMKYFKK